jgi:hypothetical protein
MTGSGLVVGRCRRDIHILAGVTAEEAEVTGHLIGSEADELAYGIELLTIELAHHIDGIIDIGDNLLYIVWGLTERLPLLSSHRSWPSAANCRVMAMLMVPVPPINSIFILLPFYRLLPYPLP